MSDRPDRLPPMIVLAGGLGTRLRDRLGKDRPKVLAPIHGRPFIDYLLAWCAAQGLDRIGFALGYRADAVVAHLGQVSADHPGTIAWCAEPEPRGTAGGLAFALAELLPDGGPCLVMNGDTLVDVDLAAFRSGFARTDAEVGLVAAPVADPSRYGVLDLDPADRVLRFAEKASAPGQVAAAAWINAGVYLLAPRFQARLKGWKTGSLERDIFASLPAGAIWAYRGAARFLDIGTGTSLDEAHRLLRPRDETPPGAPPWRKA